MNEEQRKRIRAALERSWSAKTCVIFEPDYPSYGQCAQTAIVLQELFEGPYFCVDVDARHKSRARPFAGHPTVTRLAKLAREEGVVLPVSFGLAAGVTIGTVIRGRSGPARLAMPAVGAVLGLLLVAAFVQQWNRVGDAVGLGATLALFSDVTLVDIVNDPDSKGISGEWIGFVKVSAAGAKVLREMIGGLDERALATLKMPDLLRQVTKAGHKVHVVYSTGDWLDVDSVADVIKGSAFR